MSRSGGNAYKDDDGIFSGDDQETYHETGLDDSWDYSLEAMEALPAAPDGEVVASTWDGKLIRKYWETFPSNHVYMEKHVFSRALCIHAVEEVDELLRATFPQSAESNVPMGGMSQWVREYLNYEIDVVRVQNYNAIKMQDLFGQLHELGEAITLFHGTCAAAAKIIAKNGPTPGVGVRNLWGKGFYGSPDSGHAGVYATPDFLEDGTQTILVLDFLAGNTVIGYEDLVNFGYTLDGQQIFTATDDSFPPKIYVGCHSCQYSVRYIIKLRLD